MKPTSFISAIILACLLSGCATPGVTPEKVVATGNAPATQEGYVGGNFTLGKPDIVLAIIVTNQDTRQEVLIPFSVRPDFEPGQNDTTLVPIAPGTYRATHWTAYKQLWGSSGKEFKDKLQQSRLTAPFEVAPGQTVFLGQFIGEGVWSVERTTSRTEAALVTNDITREDAQQLVRTSYPKFADLPFSCIACVAQFTFETLATR